MLSRKKREIIICQKGYVKKSNYSWLTFASAEGAFLLLKLDTSDSRRPIHAQEDCFLFLFLHCSRNHSVRACSTKGRRNYGCLDHETKRDSFFHKAQKRSLFLFWWETDPPLWSSPCFSSPLRSLRGFPAFLIFSPVPLRVVEKRLRSKSSFSSLLS